MNGSYILGGVVRDSSGLPKCLRRYLSSEAGWDHPIQVYPHGHTSETGCFRAELGKPLLCASGLCRQSELRPTAWSPAGTPAKAQTKSTRRFCISARAWPPDLHAQQVSTDKPNKQQAHAQQAYDTNTDISHANFWKAMQGPP